MFLDRPKIRHRNIGTHDTFSGTLYLIDYTNAIALAAIGNTNMSLGRADISVFVYIKFIQIEGGDLSV